MRKCSKISRSVLAGILAASMLAITACGGVMSLRTPVLVQVGMQGAVR